LNDAAPAGFLINRKVRECDSPTARRRRRFRRANRRRHRYFENHAASFSIRAAKSQAPSEFSVRRLALSIRRKADIHEKAVIIHEYCNIFISQNFHKVSLANYSRFFIFNKIG